MTDENLALKAQEHDYESEIELFTRYKNNINRISRSFFLVGGDTEDLIQEGMIGLYKAIKHYSIDKQASFSTFANLCIKRQIQSAVKMATAHKNKILSTAIPIAEEDTSEDDEHLGLVIPSSAPTPDDSLISQETINEIKLQIKEKLSVLELKILSQYLAGKSYNEISEKLGLNKKSVDNALSRIKSKLSFLKNDH